MVCVEYLSSTVSWLLNQDVSYKSYPQEPNEVNLFSGVAYLSGPQSVVA